ncbi:MAG TPA: Hsp20/alpha crystallin family protein [Bacilli bacterium]|nr:Hsp20/alpha crystallin family protein [Bacilli bacterium]
MQLVPIEAMRQYFDQHMLPMLHKMMPYGTLTPRVEVAQTPHDVVITAEVPGIEKKDDLHIRVMDTSVTIAGEVVREPSGKEGHDLLHTERTYGRFSRTVPLPVVVNPQQVRAQYRNGLLTITVSKNQNLQGKPVQVDFH